MTVADYEQRRQLALRRYGLLDTPPEAIFDGITVAIANICEVPIALISLVDADRQWFKSAYGLQARETPRDIAFCDCAIQTPDDVMIIEDATTDPRFEDNLLVTGDPNIRFYAGKPLVTEDGYALGALCVIDRVPRRLRPHQLEALEALGNTVSAILDERRRLQDVAIDRDGVETVLSENAERYQHLYQDSELMLHGLLQRLPAAAVVINRHGTILSSNDAWIRFSSQVGWVSCISGVNYLTACEFESAPFGDDRATALRGIREVLAGNTERFALEFKAANADYLLEAEAVAAPSTGAIIQHYILAGA